MEIGFFQCDINWIFLEHLQHFPFLEQRLKQVYNVNNFHDLNKVNN